MLTINENSRLPLGWILLPSVSVDVQTLHYRVDCESTGREITGWTALDAETETDLTIPSASNAILNRANSFELKTITVSVNKDMDSEITSEITWRVKNLFGAT